MTISSAQSRAARGLLEWSQQQLAEAAHIGLSTLRGFENGSRQPIANNLTAIRTALEAAGIQFIEQGSVAGGPGVVLNGQP